MYDDLARTQQRPLLESLVVNAVIPSVVVSLVLNLADMRCDFGGMRYYDTYSGYSKYSHYTESDYMRAMSSVASITIHASLGAAVLFGNTKSGRSTPSVAIDTVAMVLPEPPRRGVASGISIGVPTPEPSSFPDVASIPILTSVLQGEALIHPLFPTDWAPRAGVPSGGPDGSGVAFGNAAPEVLSGPIPVYPELLRQAGVEGQVVLEARVDSTGRVQRASIAVVSATHQGFVEPARQALLATLFRPAQVNGRAVSILVRVPFAFSIRGGTGRAR